MNRQNLEARKDTWFKPVRGSYLPASRNGWLIYIPFAGYLVFSGLVAADNASSVAVAILLIVPNWVAATVVVTYIAERTSHH
jgi:hypothetical protein